MLARVLPLALLVVSLPRVEAQSFGIKGGLTFATLSESDLSPNFKNQTGFAAGIHVGLGRGAIAFQPEALIAQLGTGVEDPTGDGELKVSYLVIPANLRINLGTAGIQPFILGGPYAAFKLSCNVEDLIPSDDCDDLDLSGTDWGLNFGGGLRFGSWFAEARYALGLKDISDVSAGFDTKQRVFLVMVGFGF